MSNSNNYEIKSGKALIVVGFTAFFFAAVGILLIFNVFAAGTNDNVDYFTVADPSSDKTCNLNEEPNNDGVVVEYYDGSSWSTVSTSDYTHSGQTVVVDSDAFD